MSTKNRKLILYSVIAASGSLAAGVTVPMFGDGTIAWAEFRFAWTKLILGVILSVSATIKAFYSEPQEGEPLPPGARDTLERLETLSRR